jgi:hypothetical protein
MKETPKQKSPAPVPVEPEASTKVGKTMPPPSLFGFTPDKQDKVSTAQTTESSSAATKQAGANPMLLAQAQATPVVDDNGQAWNHYFNGNSRAVDIGPNTINLLLNHEEFQRRHGRITGGLTTSLTGSFSVDMERAMFHVGSTNVDYRVAVNGDQCTVTYTLFVNDGFWDPDYVDEWAGRITRLPRWQPDGMGPNLERLGGKPYPYNPVTRSFTFRNPGYKK